MATIKVKEPREKQVTLKLSISEAKGLRMLLSGGTAMGTISKLGLSELERILRLAFDETDRFGHFIAAASLGDK